MLVLFSFYMFLITGNSLGPFISPGQAGTRENTSYGSDFGPTALTYAEDINLFIVSIVLLWIKGFRDLGRYSRTLGSVNLGYRTGTALILRVLKWCYASGILFNTRKQEMCINKSIYLLQQMQINKKYLHHLQSHL